MASRKASRTAASGRWRISRGRRAERSDRPRHQHVAAGHVARLAGELRAAPGQPAGPVGQAVGRQPDAVRAERGGLDDVRPDRQVLAVDRADQVRPRRHQVVEHRALRDAAAEQKGAHRAVREQRTRGQAIAESHPGVAGCHVGSRRFGASHRSASAIGTPLRAA